MEALMKAINDILASKDLDISCKNWRIESLEKELAEVKKENEALKADIKMYQENEEKTVCGFVTNAE